MAKIYSDFNLIISQSNGFERNLSIYFCPINNECFIQIRDYNKRVLLDGGLCFKWREISWLINQLFNKRKISSIYSSKNCEICFNLDKFEDNYIHIFQKTNTKFSIEVLNNLELSLINNSMKVIYKHMNKLINKLKYDKYNSEEPMNLDEEPQTISLY